MSEWNKEHELSKLAYFVDSKIDAKKILPEVYISTDNMKVDRGGIEPALKLPAVPKFSHFKENDTLFSNIRTYFRKIWLAEFEGGSSADVLAFRTKDHEKLDPIYLYYLLSSKEFTDYTVLTAKGVKMPRGDKSAMMQYKFYLPDLQYQKIASKTLRSLDSKIKNNRRMSETLEGMAQAIFKSWFVDFDPVKAKMAVLEAGGSAEDSLIAAMQAISGMSSEDLATLRTQNEAAYAELKSTAEAFPSTFTESPLGPIPEGWDIKKTEDVAEKIAMGPFGSNIKVETFVQSGIPIISGQHLRETLATEDDYNYITEDHANKLSNSCVYASDIIFTHAGNIGQVSLIPENTKHKKYVISQRQFYLRPDKNKVSSAYLVYFFRSHHGQHILLSNASQVGVPSIARPSTHLKNIELIIPGCEIMMKFESICGAIFNTITSNRDEIKTLAKTRDSLLPKLLSGEIDVSGVSDTEVV